VGRDKARGNGDGDVWPRKNREGKVIGYRGSYQVLTADGPKRRYVSGKTKTEARNTLNKANKAEAGRGIVFSAENTTVGEYLGVWLENSVKGSVAHRTYHSYRSHVGNHLRPTLGGIRLKNLSPAHVQQLYRSKLDSGLSSSSVRYTHAVLHRALKQALRWDLVPRNVCEVVDPPRVVNKEITPLDREQSRVFLEAAREDRHAALYFVATTCGLREGELFGLMDADVDLDRRTVRVERQLMRLRDGGGFDFPDPKHGSKRTVKLPAKAVDVLADHRERQAFEARKLKGLYEDMGLIFASQRGTPLDASNVVNRSFKPLLRSAGLPGIRFHDLRHTCATLLLLKNVNPKYVQRLLGHKSIKITLDLYSHWIPEMDDFTADAMDEIF
jgi:integrase